MVKVDVAWIYGKVLEKIVTEFGRRLGKRRTRIRCRVWVDHSHVLFLFDLGKDGWQFEGCLAKCSTDSHAIGRG